MRIEPQCCVAKKSRVTYAKDHLAKQARRATRNDRPSILAEVHKAKDDLDRCKAALTDHLASCDATTEGSP